LLCSYITLTQVNTIADKRFKAGKVIPEPFLLAAECLGYHASNHVVSEDSPSSIRQAGIAHSAGLHDSFFKRNFSDLNEVFQKYI